MANDPRLLYASVLWETAAAHPVMGVGLGNFALAGAARVGSLGIMSAHNVWGAHLVEGGMVGLAILLFLAGAVVRLLWIGLRDGRRAGHPWMIPLAGLSAGLLAMGLQYLTWGDRFDPYCWFVAALAMLVAGMILKEIRKGCEIAPS